MNIASKKLLFFFVLGFSTALSASPKTRTLYNSLDPKSVAQHLAFYELYPDTLEGRLALQDAWSLLSGSGQAKPIPFHHSSISSIIALSRSQPRETTGTLAAADLQAINELAARLPNRKLKGFHIESEKELLELSTEEIDLSRALLLTEAQGSEYLAMLDLMALQILARTSLNAAPEEKIQAINRLVFEEMGFRFPPHSLYAKEIDHYTFLPSVLDSRKGVCLGVSILYICLAQRLNLKLEMITPPGHIYVRYKEGDQTINIETTARGIHIDDEQYMGMELRKLQERSVKEVIGLASFNQASTYLQQEKFDRALQCYRQAEKFLDNDLLLRELMGYTYLFLEEKEKGKELLQGVAGVVPDWGISCNTVAEDYLAEQVDAEGIQAIYQHVDETRESILKKKNELEGILKRHPRFRAGWFHLGVLWLQLHRQGEALEALEHYHTLHQKDPSAEYYLAALNAQRMEYRKSRTHLQQAEKLTEAYGLHPKPLKEMRKQLSILSPE